MGIKITESRISNVAKINGDGKVVEVNDLINVDGSTAGTEVVIKMPAN